MRRLRAAPARGRARDRRRASILEASLEVRGAIVYATLIDVVAAAAGLLPRRPVRRVLPAAGDLLRPGAAGLDGGRATVTPALAPDPAAQGAARAARVAARARAAAGTTACCWRAIVDRPRPAYVRGRRLIVVWRGSRAAAARPVAAADFKERDFLMHWLTKPGTSVAEEVRITPAGLQGAARASPACATSASHIGQALLCRRGRTASTSARTGSASTRRSTTTRRSPRSRRSSTAIPGSYRDVQTYLKERIREVLTGSQRRDRRPHLRRRTCEVLREKAEEVKEVARATSTGVDRRARRAAGRHPADRGQGRSRRRRSSYGLKPGDVRRAAATLVAGEEVGDIFRDGKAYDVQVWSTPETRDSLSDIREPADRHAQRRAACGSATSPTSRIVPTPNVIEREDTARGASTSSANVEGARPRLGGRGRRGRAGRGRAARSSTTPRCWASTPSARRRQTACSCSPIAAALGDLPPAAGVLRELAAGDPGLPHPARRRWSAACWRRSSAAASSRSARWSGSSPCSGSRPATASC